MTCIDLPDHRFFDTPDRITFCPDKVRCVFRTAIILFLDHFFEYLTLVPHP
jgi:hypothetical protein